MLPVTWPKVSLTKIQLITYGTVCLGPSNATKCHLSLSRSFLMLWSRSGVHASTWRPYTVTLWVAMMKSMPLEQLCDVKFSSWFSVFYKRSHSSQQSSLSYVWFKCFFNFLCSVFSQRRKRPMVTVSCKLAIQTYYSINLNKEMNTLYIKCHFGIKIKT